jgi:hypothetical protein
MKTLHHLRDGDNAWRTRELSSLARRACSDANASRATLFCNRVINADAI